MPDPDVQVIRAWLEVAHDPVEFIYGLLAEFRQVQEILPVFLAHSCISEPW